MVWNFGSGEGLNAIVRRRLVSTIPVHRTLSTLAVEARRGRLGSQENVKKFLRFELIYINGCKDRALENYYASLVTVVTKCDGPIAG